VMPGQAGISWQAHMGGFIGGVLTARSYRARRLATAF
jgi:membrane associated rhomboid family serine protease